MSDNIQEAEVGSGTKVADTKKSEKRAQLTLKAIQLRLKQEKERAALQQQKKSLSVKEDIGESFSPSQIAALKAEYSKISGIDPASDTYKKLIAMLDKLDLKTLQSLAGAEIKFVSKLAQNRVARKSMKKEEVQIDELSTNKLADYKKKAGENASAADKAGDTKTGNKRFSGIMKATRKQFDNDAKPKTEELSPKQKAEIDKNKNGEIDATDLAHLRSKKKLPQGADFAAQRRKERMASNGRMDETVEVEESASNLKPGWMLKRDPELAKKVKEKQDLAKKRQATYGDKSAGKSVNEKSDYEVYHKDYSTAVQTAIKQAEKRGFEVDMDDWHDKVATGPKKPSSGKTNSFSINLMKDGKPSKKKLQMQVYNMDNHKYELNMYIEEIQLDELNKDTLHSYAKKSEKDQDDQYDKIGKGIRDKDPKSANKAGHKFSMRSIGQNRAEKRLAKEGVVDEAGPGLWANIHAKRERIKNGSNERMKKPGEKGAPEAGALDRARGKNEAASPAQQAAIAIAMKKDGKKPKDIEEMTDGDKSSVALQAMVARKKLQQTAGKNKSQSFIDKMTSKANAGDRLPKKPADEYDRKVVKYLKKKHGMSEGIVDKIKAIKRGMQAKAKADDHFDKAGDPKNANASKDLKKAVRYHNLLNKEEVVLEAKKSKTFKNIKKKMKEEETPNKSTVKKGDMLTGKKEPIEINPEIKS